MSLTESERRHLIDLLSERPARDSSELILALVEANPAAAAVVTRLLQAGGLHDVDQRHSNEIEEILGLL